MAKTTKKDFKLFCNEVDKFIFIFGLRGWEIACKHESLEDGWAAKCHYWLTDRCADITLATEWDDEKFERCDTEIRKAAFHECCELLLARIQIIAENRFVQPREIEEEIHHIIKVLENVLFPKY